MMILKNLIASIIIFLLCILIVIYHTFGGIRVVCNTLQNLINYLYLKIEDIIINLLQD